MKILFERSGGFTGISRTHNVSTAELPGDEAEQLTNLVHQSGFYDLPPVIPSTGSQADHFQYQITVDGDRGTHSVRVDEGAVPPRLKPVLDWLNNSERSKRKPA